MSSGIPLRPPGVSDSGRHRWISVAVALWLGGVIFGSTSMWRFAYTPGDSPSVAPSEQPAERKGNTGTAVLLVFAHPRCSCSEATIGELARIRSENRGLDIRVYFYTPAKASPAWTDTGLWKAARRIPNARVQADPGGLMAARMGARTSGQSYYYDQAGHLAFAGGITAFRGHYGDNDGHDAIAALAQGGTPLHRRTPVFGCSLAQAVAEARAR